MGKKLLATIILFSLLFPLMLKAQNGTISGTISDKATGELLPGANVYIIELKRGASSDLNGEYSITGLPSGTYTVVATYVSYKQFKQTVDVGVSELTLDIGLSPDFLGLEELVVNALGFEENRDQLGSATTRISAESIQSTGETSVLTAISGKSAGVRITRSSGDPGAGAFIQIRGQSSITGNLQPLFVVDGVPVYNTQVGAGSVEGVVQQSRLNDLNPNDIESVEILRGASAAALWGARAANGVIVIKTKQGKAVRGRPNISIKSTTSFDEINRVFDLQDSFGQGRGGSYSPTLPEAWGDRIADRSGAADEFDQTGRFFEAADGDRYYPITGKNSQETFRDQQMDQVFQNGFFNDNSLSISGGDEGSSYYFSLANLSQEGIIRNNSDYDRTSMRFNLTRRFNEDISMKSSATYSRVTSNRIQQGSNLAGLYLGMLRQPPDFNSEDYIGDYVDAAGLRTPNSHRSYRRYLGDNANPVYNNPGWTINQQSNTTDVDRFLASSELQYDPTDWLGFTARGGVDFYQDIQNTYFPLNSASPGVTGSFTEQSISQFQLNFDFIGRMQKQINEDLFGSFLMGFNVNDRRTHSIGGGIQNFILADGPLDFSNATAENATPFDNRSQIRIAALYGVFDTNFKEMLFLKLTGRAEAASSYGQQSDQTFFYPSAEVAWQFTQLPMLKDKELLSFGKLRAGFGVVGVQPAVYATSTDFVGAAFGESWGGALSSDFYGNGGFVQSFNQGNPFLRPERKTEIEIGTDLRFLNDRLYVSATYYQNETTDVLLSVPVAASTGFTSQYLNAADIQNTGFEIETGFEVISNNDMRWDIGGNWTRNRNEVTNLAGAESIFLAGFTGTSSRAVEGHQLGVLWGGRFNRDAAGELVLNSNGFPTQAPDEGVLGDPNPDWFAGFNTSISIKNVTISALFEHQQGGDMWVGTLAVLDHFGTSARSGNESVSSTDLVEANGNVIPAGTTFRGNVHDFGAGPVALTESWYRLGLGSGFGPVSEPVIFDATHTRLRELTLSYVLNSKSFRETTNLRSIEFSATGRNLLLWTYEDGLKGLDPESNLTGASNGRGLNYFNNPNTRSLLFSISINY